jgi:hypothetical protein
VGFEPTITASERAKKIHALDRSATVTAMSHFYVTETTTPEMFSDLAATKRRLFHISTTLHKAYMWNFTNAICKVCVVIFSVSLTYVSWLRKYNETWDVFCGHLYFLPSTSFSVVLLLTQSPHPCPGYSWLMMYEDYHNGYVLQTRRLI